MTTRNKKELRKLQIEVYRLFKGPHNADALAIKLGLIRDMQGITGYQAGQCRNDDTALSHTYAMMKDGGLLPMCGYGWNRSNGSRFSIFRGTPGTEGDCKLCRDNVRYGRSPIRKGFRHKTRWL